MQMYVVHCTWTHCRYGTYNIQSKYEYSRTPKCHSMNENVGIDHEENGTILPV